MPTKPTTHVLMYQEQLVAIAKRMKRAHGQNGAVIPMLDEGRSCDDIVTQMAAGKAINTATFKLLSASLKECIEEATIGRDVVTEKLQKLVLSLA